MKLSGNHGAYESLVLKAVFQPVYSGHTTKSGVFIGSNASAEKLEKMGSEILPAIEFVILNNLPISEVPERQDKIASVLNSYFRIAHRSATYAGCVRFLARMEPCILEIALSEIRGLWGPTNGPNRLRPVPEWLSVALEQLKALDRHEGVSVTIDWILRED